MATAPPALSSAVLQDVIELQGKEIGRLKAQLAREERQVRSLQRTKEKLEVARSAKQSRESAADSCVPVDTAHGTSDFNVDISVSTVHHSVAPPTYDGMHLRSFGRGKRAKRHFNEIRGQLAGLRIKERDVLPGTGYDSLQILKPLQRMTKRGTMVTSGPGKQLYNASNEVAILLDGAWYYLGQYRYVEDTVLGAEWFQALPAAIKQSLVASCGRAAHGPAIEAKLWNGEITVYCFHLHREGFNDALYRRLVDVSDDNGSPEAHGAEDDSEGED